MGEDTKVRGAGAASSSSGAVTGGLGMGAENLKSAAQKNLEKQKALAVLEKHKNVPLGTEEEATELDEEEYDSDEAEQRA